MPVTVTIDAKRKLTITTAEGVVTDADFINARKQLLARPDFDPDFDRIWDFQRVSDSKVTDKVIAQLVAESPNADKPICRAVVMSEKTEAMKSILDFISLTRKANRRVAAFPDLASAEKWVLAARSDLPPM